VPPRSRKLPRQVRGPVEPEPEAAAPRKADRVARDVLARIVSGELAIGTILPREDELAAHYKVNRGVVREAVKLLEVHRLVRPVRRRGTVVLDAHASMSPEVLAAMLAPQPGHVDRHVLGAFLEVRAIIDAEMTSLAATRRTQADVRAMRAVLAELEDALGEPARYARLGQQLGRLVARASQNPLFEMLGAYNVRVANELESILSVARPPSRAHLDGLGLLVRLVDKKDADGARRIVQSFHAWAIPRILATAALASGAPPARLTKDRSS